MSIIQWNINGFFLHLGELQSIAKKFKPEFICLQETHLKPDKKISLADYKAYRKDRADVNHASGGVTTFIKNSNHVEEIVLTTNLEAIALKTHHPDTLTICNIYIAPPPYILNQATLENLINQLPKPYILCGDFNAHNIIWGSKISDQRGKMLEEILEDLTLLNDHTPTHFCARSGNFSNIDLTFCDPRITPDLTWNVINCLYTSDHFPIQLNHILINQTTPPPHCETWNIKKS